MKDLAEIKRQNAPGYADSNDEFSRASERRREQERDRQRRLSRRLKREVREGKRP